MHQRLNYKIIIAMQKCLSLLIIEPYLIKKKAHVKGDFLHL